MKYDDCVLSDYYSDVASIPVLLDSVISLCHVCCSTDFVRTFSKYQTLLNAICNLAGEMKSDIVNNRVVPF